jgi:hypothetical protein
MTQEDLNIINSVDISQKPPGTSTLAWLVAKREAIEANKHQREAKQRLDTYSGQRREIERRALGGQTLAKPTSVSSPAAAPRFPHLDKLASLSGTEAAHFYRANKSAIIAEEAVRKQAIASAQVAANCRAAKSGKGFTSHI